MHEHFDNHMRSSCAGCNDKQSSLHLEGPADGLKTNPPPAVHDGQAYDVDASGKPYQFRSLVFLLNICGNQAVVGPQVSPMRCTSTGMARRVARGTGLPSLRCASCILG